MYEYLKTLLPKIKTYSESLSKQSVFIDHPWVVVDESGKYIKLIFKAYNELILSENGGVKIGRWEYLSSAQLLLIDNTVEKKLYRQEFLDDAIMVLKLDGTNYNFYTLVNELKIPDLDLVKYLENLEKKEIKKKIESELKQNPNNIFLRLKDGNEIRIEEDTKLVYLNNELIANGRWELAENKGFLITENGLLGDRKYYYETKLFGVGNVIFECKNGTFISVVDIVYDNNVKNGFFLNDEFN